MSSCALTIGMKDTTTYKRIRDKLNHEKIKLWLEPYSSSEDALETLAEQFSNDLNLPRDHVRDALQSLRSHACFKFSAREQYKNTGIATLRLKIAKTQGAELEKIQDPAGLSIKLTENGKVLKRDICQKCGLSEDADIKLICCGHVIKDDQSLIDQNVKHESQIMVIIPNEQRAKNQLIELAQSKFEDTRNAARILSQKVQDETDASSEYYLQITDQAGKTIDLPPDEHQAITLAMTLHEKGRAALNRKSYTESILLLLEADAEFSKCRADILNAVDNYAILCLDIVWCYYNLRNLDGLPDAKSRLEKCKDCLLRSHGHGLQRVAALKGNTLTDRVLYLKLHVLEAVIAYHQEKLDFAQERIHLAGSELAALTVNTESIAQLLTLGFSEREARLVLRATNGDVSQAVSLAFKKREVRAERKDKHREEQRLTKLSKHIGKTNLGLWADAKMFESLLGMGFRRGPAAEALKRSNNDLNLALQILETHPEIQLIEDPTFTVDNITSAMLAQITSMGFDEQTAVKFITNAGGVIEKALDALLTGKDPIQNSSSAVPQSSSKDISNDREKKEQDNAAIATIVHDLDIDEESHLDIDLCDLKAVIEEYSALIQSVYH